MSEEQAYLNTDKEIYERDGYYSPHLYITESGALRIEVGGLSLAQTIEEWHKSFNLLAKLRDEVERLKKHSPIRTDWERDFYNSALVDVLALLEKAGE